MVCVDEQEPDPWPRPILGRLCSRALDRCHDGTQARGSDVLQEHRQILVSFGVGKPLVLFADRTVQFEEIYGIDGCFSASRTASSEHNRRFAQPGT